MRLALPACRPSNLYSRSVCSSVVSGADVAGPVDRHHHIVTAARLAVAVRPHLGSFRLARRVIEVCPVDSASAFELIDDFLSGRLRPEYLNGPLETRKT